MSMAENGLIPTFEVFDPGADRVPRKEFIYHGYSGQVLFSDP